MFGSHAIARELTGAGLTAEQADAITNAVRQAAEQHGDYATRTELESLATRVDLAVQIAMPMQPRFPVNDRTRGTATAETPGSIPAGFSRSVPPIQAGVGVVRLKPAGERAPQGSVLVQSNGRQGHGNRSSIRQPK